MSADAKQIKTKTLETLSPCIDLHILNLFTTSTLAFTIRQQNGSLQHFMETTFSDLTVAVFGAQFPLCLLSSDVRCQMEC